MFHRSARSHNRLAGNAQGSGNAGHWRLRDTVEVLARHPTGASKRSSLSEATYWRMATPSRIATEPPAKQAAALLPAANPELWEILLALLSEMRLSLLMPV